MAAFVHALSTEQKVVELANAVQEVNTKLDQALKLINAAWALTTAQQVGSIGS